jgi:integral membrane sensor domain MASE1
MERTRERWKRVAWRAFLFFLASATSSCLPLALAGQLWPHGGNPGAAYMFWVASGVNVAGVLILGWRYAPVLLLDALPFYFLLDVPPELAVMGSLADTTEAFLAWWVIVQIGRYAGSFERLRSVLALLLTVFASAPGAMIGVWCLIREGNVVPSNYWPAVGNWLLGNNTAILMLTPLLTKIVHRHIWRKRTRREWIAWIIGGVGCGVLTFHTVVQSGQTNFAFLLFPYVILAAVRFGINGASVALGFVMASLFATLLYYAPAMTPELLGAKIWFLQSFYWVLAATGLVVAALAGERRVAEKRLLVEQNRTLEAQLRAESARLEALRYQIHPHFLFNALNSIRATLPLEAMVPREMVTDLGEFLRSTLNHPSTNVVPLIEEIELMERYLAIEKRRFGEDLQVSIRLDPSIGQTPVPVLLLQPLVENAIRHGLQANPERFRLQVIAKRDDSHLCLQVANTGVWREPQPDEERPGLGLANIRRRLELIYGAPATLNCLTHDGWVRMTILLPLPPEIHALPDC